MTDNGRLTTADNGTSINQRLDTRQMVTDIDR